jgi:hypothetical protein
VLGQRAKPGTPPRSSEPRGFQQASTITTDLVKGSTGHPALELVEKPIGRDFKYVEAASAHA